METKRYLINWLKGKFKMSDKIEKAYVWGTRDRKVNFQAIGNHPHFGLDSLFFSYFANFMLENRGRTVVYKRTYSANTQDADFFTKEILNAYKEFHISLMLDGNNQKFFVWEHGCAELTSYPGSNTIHIMTINKPDLDKAYKLAADNWKAAVKTGKVYAIANIDRELTITSLGIAGIPLEKTNYAPKVVEDYKIAIKDFSSKTPSGRMVIMNGEPGTGKTYLVRAMLMDVPNATFLLIPPTMIPELSGPTLISLLLENRHTLSANGPTILVLEDADYCLAPRKSDNMSAISSILNMGDGIFGSLFDIRILATTNAETREIDPAILRAGRLSTRIDVDKLEAHEATKVLKRLIPNTKASINKKMTIAEVYKMARDNGWEPPQDLNSTKESDDSEEEFYEDD